VAICIVADPKPKCTDCNGTGIIRRMNKGAYYMSPCHCLNIKFSSDSLGETVIALNELADKVVAEDDKKKLDSESS